jgi:hypothetical protein
LPAVVVARSGAFTRICIGAEARAENVIPRNAEASKNCVPDISCNRVMGDFSAVAVPAKRIARVLPQRASMGTAATVAAAPSPSEITDHRVPPRTPDQGRGGAAILEVGDAFIPRRERRAPLQRLDHRGAMVGRSTEASGRAST